MTNLVTFEDLRKEFKADEKGITFVTKRGLARLCGIQAHNWNKKQFLFSKELDAFIIEELGVCSVRQNASYSRDFLLEALTNKGLIVFTKNNFEIQDLLASLVIEFYAQKKVPQARITNRAVRAIGVRSAIRETIGWTQGKKEYGSWLLYEPRQWSKIFCDEFYDELSRLTGWEWDRQTHQRPCIFAKLTYDLVYSHLPNDIYETIKKTQKEHGGYLHKMHQYLNEEGLQKLKQHLELCLNILSAVSSVDDAKLLVNQSVTRNYQRSLFSV